MLVAMSKRQSNEDVADEYDFSSGVRGKFYRPGAVFSVVGSSMSNLSRITVRTEQMHGQPCIRGMRIRVSDVLELLAGGMTYDEVLADYPYLERDDIFAALAYAAQAMRR